MMPAEEDLQPRLNKILKAIKNKKTLRAQAMLSEDCDNLIYFASTQQGSASVKILLNFISAQPVPATVKFPSAGVTRGFSSSLIEGRFSICDILFETLLQHSEDINPIYIENDSKTALHLAAEQGHLPVVQKITLALKAKGQETNPIDPEGYTPLHCASAQGHLDVVKFICQHTQDISPLQGLFSPLYIALDNKHFDIFTTLLNTADERNQEINPALETGDTLLHLSAHGNNFDCFKLLLEKLIARGKPLNFPRKHDDCTPLHIAAHHAPIEFVQLFVKTLHTMQQNLSPIQGASTPYEMAAYEGRLDIVLIFLEHGPLDENINPLTQFSDQTLFEYAVSNEHLPVINAMLPLLIQQYDNASSIADQYNLLSDVLRGLVYTRQNEQLALILCKLLSVEANQTREQKYNICQTTFILAGLHGNIEAINIAIKCLLNLTQNMQWNVKLLKEAVKWDESYQDVRIFSETITLLESEVKAFHAFKERHKLNFKSHLKDKPWTQSMAANHTMLVHLQSKYEALSGALHNALRECETLYTVKEIQEYAKSFKKYLAPIKCEYEEARRVFLEAEMHLKEAAKAQVMQLLIRHNEELFSTNLVMAQVKELLSSGKIGNKRQAVLACSLETLDLLLIQYHDEKSKCDYSLSPGIEQAFILLSEGRRSLSAHLTVIMAEEQLIAQEQAKKRYQAVILEIDTHSRSLARKIHVIKKFMANPNNALFQVKCQNILEKFENDRAQIISQVPKNNADAENQLRDIQKILENCSLAITELKHYVRQTKEQNHLALHEQRENLKALAARKTNEIKHFILSIRCHPMHDSILQHPEDLLYLQCMEYKTLFDTIQPSDLSSTNGVLKEEIRRYERHIALLDRHLENMRDSIPTIKETLDERLAHQLNSSRFLPITEAKLSLTYAYERAQTSSYQKRQSPPPHLQLLSRCDNEKRQLEVMLEILSQTQEQNVTKKSNALLLNLALVFEGMKRAYRSGTLVNALFPEKELRIRNAIFHHVLENKHCEQSYQALYQFATHVHRASQGIGPWQSLLDEFFVLFPNTVQDPAASEACIKDHIEHLGHTDSEIIEGNIEFNKNLILQSDIAFRIAQLSAMLNDLKMNDPQQYALLCKHISLYLPMNPFVLRQSANAVRHDGIEALEAALEVFQINLVKRLSILTLQQEAENKSPENELAASMEGLTLDPSEGSNRLRKMRPPIG